ncbi:hypothetical protein [Brachyspira sp.]|uniref:hypothetical protein n=1 Tax=Brachyspira sp. TaxID=1977261 RepID=UPI002639A4F3|nr:hypothetical protein [Brachyspira sp.]
MKKYITIFILLFFITIFNSCSQNNSNTNNSLIIYCTHQLKFINFLNVDVMDTCAWKLTKKYDKNKQSWLKNFQDILQVYNELFQFHSAL